jgi:hypothetical protein
MNRILEDFKAMGAAAVGIGSQYAPFSTWVQISLGLLSCIYLFIRIVKAIRDWDQKDRDDDIL